LDRFKPLDVEACRSRLGWDRSSFHVLFPANNGDPVKRPDLARASVDALKKSDVNAELHFLKGVPYEEVPIWFNASDALLLTSFHEGSPTVVKEALACNVPVVAVDVGDVAEQIRGVEGCFISEADPEELAAKLKLVYLHQRRVSSRALMEKFDLDRIAMRVADVYKSTMNQFNSQKRARNEFRRFIFRAKEKDGLMVEPEYG
jgi:teichuronic acid biosynthesis glycosyltransferase TuaC